jgi:hypothetical protein
LSRSTAKGQLRVSDPKAAAIHFLALIKGDLDCEGLSNSAH